MIELGVLFKQPSSKSCNELGNVSLRDSVTGLQRSAHQSELLVFLDINNNYADHYNNTVKYG